MSLIKLSELAEAMSHIKLIIPALIILSGCASQTAANFTPFTVEIKSQQALSQDLNICRRYAQDYLTSRPGLDASQIAQESLTGGLKQLPSIPLSPLTPALGAAGSGSTEVISELGLSGPEAKKVITICLHDKGQKSDLYHVYDPNN